MEHPVTANPAVHCPPEILKQIIALEVPYYSFDNQKQRGIIEINNAVVSDIQFFFETAYRLRFPIERVARASNGPVPWNDAALMAANISSGFNYRLIAGTDKVSLHGRGLAFDVNPQQNPYLRFTGKGQPIVAPAGAIWKRDAPGTLHKNHRLVEDMLDRGWKWGGSWQASSGRIDYQHFQKEAKKPT